MTPDRSSHIFRFKRFAVANTRSAQRIGTDGVIVGATAPMPPDLPSTSVVWDVGSGTGLIALMVAQRFPCARIVAVEIDPEAADECDSNIADSPWASRMTAIFGDIHHLAPSLPAPSLIVSNPPFFAKNEAVTDSRRALARHDGSLSPSSLISLAAGHLAPGGLLHFIAPYDRSDEIMLKTELERMEAVCITDIASRSDRGPIRRLWTMARRGEARVTVAATSRLDLRTADTPGEFSEEYRRLTHDFYLDF